MYGMQCEALQSCLCTLLNTYVACYHYSLLIFSESAEED